MKNVHLQFVSFSREAMTRNVLVGRYVIMPDHIHFFAAFDEQVDLSKWMKSMKNFLSKHFRKEGIKSPHWQKGFFDHLLRSEESYGSKWEYVHNNPVRHGLVADASLWPFQGEINALSFN